MQRIENLSWILVGSFLPTTTSWHSLKWKFVVNRNLQLKQWKWLYLSYFNQIAQSFEYELSKINKFEVQSILKTIAIMQTRIRYNTLSRKVCLRRLVAKPMLTQFHLSIWARAQSGLFPKKIFILPYIILTKIQIFTILNKNFPKMFKPNSNPNWP